MVNRAVTLFLVALCIIQSLHGGLSTPRLSRRSIQEGSSSSAASGNVLGTVHETASRTLDEWRESFDNIFRETSQLDTMMQNLNRTLQGLSSALDEMGNTLSNALQNSTRTSTTAAP